MNPGKFFPSKIPPIEPDFIWTVLEHYSELDKSVETDRRFFVVFPFSDVELVQTVCHSKITFSEVKTVMYNGYCFSYIGLSPKILM